jgi:hypothetical protein
VEAVFMETAEERKGAAGSWTLGVNLALKVMRPVSFGLVARVVLAYKGSQDH